MEKCKHEWVFLEVTGFLYTDPSLELHIDYDKGDRILLFGCHSCESIERRLYKIIKNQN